jgi:hypothetical protein
MSMEDELRRALADRAASLDSAPDGRDLARRIHKAQRKSRRAQQGLLVAALVVIAGSSGAVLGAFAARPGGGTTAAGGTSQTVDTNVSPSTTPSTLPVTIPPPPQTTTSTSPGVVSTTTTPRPGATGGTGGTGNTGAAVASGGAGSAVHQATLDGLQVNWLTTQLTAPVTVVSPGSSAACLPARVVTASVGGESPLAGGSGVLGLPALAPAGMAVVASGAFGSVGHPGGWWAIVETGSSAKTVGVQFPSGATVHEAVTGGVAVLAALAPTGSSAGAYSGYASAVADGPSGVTSSLEFIVGGAPATVDALNGAAQRASGRTSSGQSSGGQTSSGVSSRSLPACLPASALATSTGKSGGHSHLEGGSQGQGPAAGPPAPVMAAGEVVAAFEQAYDLDPLLGLDWSFAAVDLSAKSGCSLSRLGAVGTTGGYKLLPPAVGVDAVGFVSPERAVVIYQRGSGLRETGIAVLTGGSWKVSGATYCADMASSTSSTTTP